MVYINNLQEMRRELALKFPHITSLCPGRADGGGTNKENEGNNGTHLQGAFEPCALEAPNTYIFGKQSPWRDSLSAAPSRVFHARPASPNVFSANEVISLKDALNEMERLYN